MTYSHQSSVPGLTTPSATAPFISPWPGYLIHGTNKPAGVGLRSSHGCIRLFPEDIDELFEKVPIGTQVHVVNQPFVFGWHDGQLYLQALSVLEDDPRDWKNGQKKLLQKTFTPRIQAELKAHNEQVNWDVVGRISHEPRGLPLSVSQADSNLAQLLAQAPRVENRIPPGSNWDGADDPARQEQGDVQEMVTEQVKNAASAATPRT